jgi:ABC-type lipoprotein release transport system permease subunit
MLNNQHFQITSPKTFKKTPSNRERENLGGKVRNLLNLGMEFWKWVFDQVFFEVFGKVDINWTYQKLPLAESCMHSVTLLCFALFVSFVSTFYTTQDI